LMRYDSCAQVSSTSRIRFVMRQVLHTVPRCA
jgi:hypothetical protein